MAISAAMVWQVDGGASGVSDANNSGGFRGGAFISAPSAPTVTPSATGGTVAAATYYVVVTYTDSLGDTVISGQTAVTVSGATASFTTTSPSVSTGALTWSHYCATVSGGPYFPQGTGLTIGSNRTVTTTPPTTGTQPRGVDRSLSGTRTVVIDNSTITATTTGANSNTLTFTLGYTPSGSDVGNTCRITAGTNMTAGDYEITAVTTTTWTLAGAANATGAGGAGSAIVGGMGGCLASPGQACAFAVTSNTLFVKAGTYTIANGTSNTAGNKFSPVGMSVIGYTSNRYPGNTDTPPVLDAGAASMSVFTGNGNANLYDNLKFTNSGTFASVTAFTCGSMATSLARRITVTGCATPFVGGQTSVYEDCYVSGGAGFTTNATNGTVFVRCVAVSSTSAGFAGAAATTFQDCIAITPAGAGFSLGVAGLAQNCVTYGATGGSGSGFSLPSNGATLIDCISYGNSQKGVTVGGGLRNVSVINCAFGGNSGVDLDTNLATYQLIGNITLSGNPFTNAAGNDFSLNSTAGAGAACRQAGIPGTWPNLSTTGYRSIGAAEPAAITPGGIPHLAGRGGGLAG